MNRYNIQEDSSKLSFYGVSNGGGFGMTLFFEGENRFKNFICSSPLGAVKTNREKSMHYPNLYISYGTEELFILVDKYKDLINHLKENEFVFHSNSYNGGHNDFEWVREFSSTLIELYPKKE